MKSRKIIPLLIITNIILIGIICNFISRNGNVVKEKQVIKEMTQSENEANLQAQIDQLNLAHEEYAQNVQKYKKQIAEAITNQGVSTSENATASVMAENIGKIVSIKTTATATAADIATGKTAWVNGNKITGTKEDNSLIYIGNSENSTYDLSSINGYNNLTTENFLIKNFIQTVEVIKGGPVYATVQNNEPLSYNSTTGILTVKSSLGPNQYEHLVFSSTFDIYLQK